MDSNNWRPNQGNNPTMDTNDWRAQLPPDSRQRIVNKIMDILKKHLPVSGPDGLHELRKIAKRFEEKIFTAATSQPDYLRKISMKMLAMETKSQNTMANNMPPNQVGPSNNPTDQGLVLQPQIHNLGQQHSIPLPGQMQTHQQLLSQNVQNNVASQPNLPPVSSLAQTTSQNIVQNSNIQNLPGPNSVGSTISQNSNLQSMFPGSQRSMPGRQQVVPPQQQLQSQNPQQFLYHQQFLKQKLQLQSQMQQQQQQSLMQPNQLQSSQQSTNIQQSMQSMPQQHSQVMRHQQQQTSIVHQQQTPGTQQTILPTQQQQLMGPQSNTTNMQHAQMLGQQNNVGDVQQPQRMLSQQSNLTSMQQRQQQLINQQNNPANVHQQQLGNNGPGLQQQHLLGPDSGNADMHTSHHSAHMLQHPKVPMQQQSQQNTSNLLLPHSQQSQPLGSQQQLMPQIHTQSTQLQQQLGLQQQQQPNPSLRDMQQRIQASGSLLQQQNVLDQQKQLYQSQRNLPETSATSLDSTTQSAQPSGNDWQEEVYQKLQAMKESYLPDMNEMYQKIANKLQQHDSLLQPSKSDQIDKLRAYKMMLERMMALVQIPKSNILPHFKEKLGSYEKQIINLITNRPRKGMSSVQVGQIPQNHMSSMQQPQSQVTQLQSHENQMNSQLQSTNLQGSVSTMQQNNVASSQHNPLSGVSAGQQSMMNSMQPGTNLDSGQGNSMNSLQHVPMNSIQQTTVSTPQQQTNINSLQSQGGANVSQPNSLQSGSSALQHQLKHQQEQQMLQNQQFKQYQHRQMMQRQLLQQQQLHHPAKPQLSAQLQTHQMSQLHQMNDINDIKMRQGMGVKPGVFQQHLTSGQHSAYSHQQLKQGNAFPVSSPQHLPAASPQIQQHSSPKVEQQNHLPSKTKVATPLQSSNSPFVGPTPSPPLAPSPMPGESEKPVPCVSSISNGANIGHQQTGGAVAPAQSLAIGTPGISASPLLAEFSGPDGGHGNALAATSGKSTVTEQPLERLINVVKSMSYKALSSAVSDIGSVVSMNDRIAGSAPGNGSRAAVGEDLVSMTNCRLQARNFITQDGTNGIKRMKRYTSAIPLNGVLSAGSVNDSIKQLTASEASDLESTATSSVKKQKIEVNHALLEEIREINHKLIDTVVDISNVDPTPAVAAAEGAEGILVKCSFIAVALSPSLKSQYASAQM
ncbi:mediator of RNA polymerase II transcription subunit 15a-like isoform X2 [Phaseolus vulgaris]